MITTKLYYELKTEARIFPGQPFITKSGTKQSTSGGVDYGWNASLGQKQSPLSHSLSGLTQVSDGGKKKKNTRQWKHERRTVSCWFFTACRGFETNYTGWSCRAVIMQIAGGFAGVEGAEEADSQLICSQRRGDDDGGSWFTAPRWESQAGTSGGGETLILTGERERLTCSARLSVRLKSSAVFGLCFSLE